MNHVCSDEENFDFLLDISCVYIRRSIKVQFGEYADMTMFKNGIPNT